MINRDHNSHNSSGSSQVSTIASPEVRVIVGGKSDNPASSSSNVATDLIENARTQNDELSAQSTESLPDYQEALLKHLKMDASEFTAHQTLQFSPSKSPIKNKESPARNKQQNHVMEQNKSPENMSGSADIRRLKLEQQKQRLAARVAEKQQQRQIADCRLQNSHETDTAMPKPPFLEEQVELEDTQVAALATAALQQSLSVGSSPERKPPPSALAGAISTTVVSSPLPLNAILEKHDRERAEHEQWLIEQRRIAQSSDKPVLHETEELYDRMRAATGASTRTKPQPHGKREQLVSEKNPTARYHSRAVEDSNVSDISLSTDPGVFDPSALKVSSSFALTSNLDTSVSSRTTTNSAHERLHRAASARQQNRSNMTDRARIRESKYLEENRYTMNSTSRHIMRQNGGASPQRISRTGSPSSRKSTNTDVLQRMYADGVRDQQRKKQLVEAQEQAGLTQAKIEEWSCVKCGVYHTLDHAILRKLQLRVQTSHNTQTSLAAKHTGISTAAEMTEQKRALEAAKQNSADAVRAATAYHSRVFRCTNCGFERQDAIAPYKPMNLALHAAEKNGTAAQLLARRNEAVASSGGIVEYLRSSHPLQGQLQRQRQEWDRKDRMLTFQPQINETSRQLVQNKILQAESAQDTYDSSRRADNSESDADHMSSALSNQGSRRTSSSPMNRTSTTTGTDKSIPRRTTADPQPARRAQWMYENTLYNKKAENAVNYTHDSKATAVSNYFKQPITQRLAANIKPDIVKCKHSNSNKYQDPIVEHSLYQANRRSSMSMPSDVGGIRDITNSGGSVASASSDRRRRMSHGSAATTKFEAENVDVKEDFFTRQIQWQHKNLARKEDLRHQVHDFDPQTHQILFHPKLEVSGHLHTHEERNGDIVTRLQAKDEASKRKLAQLLQEQQQAQEKAQAANQVTALPHSKELLTKATERSIQDMFKLLLASVEITTANGWPSDASALSNVNQRIRLPGQSGLPETDMGKETGAVTDDLYTLDLALVQPTLMIPEVAELVLDVLMEKELSELHSQNAQPPKENTHDICIDMIVTFAEFRQLVYKCLDRRGKNNGYPALGRSYVCVPRKRAEVTTKMLEDQLANETFTPTMDRKSAAITRNNGRYQQPGQGKKPIEQILLRDGAKQRQHQEDLQKAKQQKEAKELTFQPQLFKPPKSLQITPRYRGSQTKTQAHDKLQQETSDSTPNEPRFGGKTLAKMIGSASHSAPLPIPPGQSTMLDAVFQPPVAPDTAGALSTATAPQSLAESLLDMVTVSAPSSP